MCMLCCAKEVVRGAIEAAMRLWLWYEKELKYAMAAIVWCTACGSGVACRLKVLFAARRCAEHRSGKVRLRSRDGWVRNVVV